MRIIVFLYIGNIFLLLELAVGLVYDVITKTFIPKLNFHPFLQFFVFSQLFLDHNNIFLNLPKHKLLLCNQQMFLNKITKCFIFINSIFLVSFIVSYMIIVNYYRCMTLVVKISRKRCRSES